MEKNVVILIEVGYGLDRTDLENLGGVYESVEFLLDAISNTGRTMYLENKIQIWELTDFMDAWNDTDDYATILDISSSFIGFAKVKHIK